jgi:hypothetical protein
MLRLLGAWLLFLALVVFVAVGRFLKGDLPPGDPRPYRRWWKSSPALADPASKTALEGSQEPQYPSQYPSSIKVNGQLCLDRLCFSIATF